MRQTAYKAKVRQTAYKAKVRQTVYKPKVRQNRQTLQKPNKLFEPVVFYVKILVLVRILDEFQKCDCDLGPADHTDHGTLCVSSGPPLLISMRTLRSKLLLRKKQKPSDFFGCRRLAEVRE